MGDDKHVIKWTVHYGVAIRDTYTNWRGKMGCDIHLTIEYSNFTSGGPDGPPYWQAFGGGFNPGRDYHMFGLLAQVRDENENGFEPRGKPDNPSYQAVEMFGSFSDDSGEYMDDSDLHSHSWLTGDEYAEAYVKAMLTSEYGPPNMEYEIILIVLREFKERGVMCRVVFAFDN